jgi:hypothetical protein
MSVFGRNNEQGVEFAFKGVVGMRRVIYDPETKTVQAARTIHQNETKVQNITEISYVITLS